MGKQIKVAEQEFLKGDLQSQALTKECESRKCVQGSPTWFFSDLNV